MKKIDFFEFTAVLAPGAVTIYGLARIYPDLGLLLADEQISFGDLGLLLVLAYVAGHLVQSFGNLIEWVWWKSVGNWPTDWVRTRKNKILADAQLNLLPARIHALLKITCPEDLKLVAEADWRAITQQAYTLVRKAGRAERIDIFNGNYGMFRGIAAALFVIIVACLLDSKDHDWRLYGALAVMLGLALLRMHRFGIHYSRELFLQFIGLQPGESAIAKKESE